MKVDKIGYMVMWILFITSMALLISIAVEPFLEPVEIHGVEGEITSVFVTQGKPMFEFNNEAYSFKRLYELHNIEIKLFTPCEIIFGKSAIWGREKIIALEYIEGEISDCNPDYIINYESFSLSKLPTVGVQLFTLCINTYDESPLYAKNALIDIVY